MTEAAPGPGNPAPWRTIELRVDLDTRLSPHVAAEWLRALLREQPVVEFTGVEVVDHTSPCGDCEASPTEHRLQSFETWQDR